jgi:chitinase
MRRALCLAFGACAASSGSAPDGSPPAPGATADAAAADASAPPALWVTAYYHACRTLPPEGLALDLLTEVVHFSVTPGSDGSVRPSSCLTDAQSSDLVARVHAAGKRVLLCVGGGKSRSAFLPAIAAPVRSKLVGNLVEWAAARGYDGVDVDMEPIEASDAADYTAFVKELRVALDARIHGAMLTAAVNWQPDLFAALQGSIDRIDYMTYDYSGAWSGWETWYNAPLSAGGKHFMSPLHLQEPLPAIDASVGQWTTAGVAPAKLGIGLPLFGVVWSGATGPNQGITGVTTSQVTYASLLDTLYDPAVAHWDGTSSVPWLGITASPPRFVSYDDERSAAAKVTWAKQAGLGGVIVWELSGDWHGGRHPVLAAAAAAAR